MSDTCIPHLDSHKDLGLVLSENLSWDKHYKFIIACAKCAYKALGIIRHRFVCFIGKVTSSLLHSVVASTFDERYAEL